MSPFVPNYPHTLRRYETFSRKNRLHLDIFPRKEIRRYQDLVLQRQRTHILRPRKRNCHPSRCIRKRLGSSTDPIWESHSLRLKITHRMRTEIRKHRTRDARRCIREYPFPYLHIWKTVHHPVISRSR